MPKFNKFIKFNRYYMAVCTSWASVNCELGLTTNRLLSIASNATILWSFIIVIATTFKLILFDEEEYIRQSANVHLFEQQQNRPATIRDLLLLQFVPHINEFAKLYFGLVLVCIGSSLIWRLYMNFYRPSKQSQHLINKSQVETKNKLVKFFLVGPVDTGDDDPLIKWLHSSDSSPKETWQEYIDLCPSEMNQDGVVKKASKKTNYLSQLYHWDVDDDDDYDDDNYDYKNHSRAKRRKRKFRLVTKLGLPVQNFSVPIRIHNFLADYSMDRWVCLAKQVYLFVVIAIILLVPILWYTANGLLSVTNNFGWEEAQAEADLWARFLKFYGLSEQVYACTQGAMFIYFTNIFIVLFHGDLVCKFNIINDKLRELATIYKTNTFETKGINLVKQQIHLVQMQVWAYFDSIDQMDSFVSKYSFVSIANFVIGISFGQSLLKVEDASLKHGMIAVLASNSISFAFLYIISYDIERRSDQLHPILCSIISREPERSAKQNWKKLLISFYSLDSKRTFTLCERYPLNLQSLFNIVFGVVTTSVITNKFFHTIAWEKMGQNSALLLNGTTSS